MRNSTKRKIIPVAFALVLSLIGSALAVPVIQVNVQQLGAGSNVITSDVQQANITWILSTTNPDYIQGVTFTLNTTVSGTIYVKLYDSSGALIQYNKTVITNTNTGTVTFNPNVDIARVARVYVIYEGPAP